MSVVRLDAELAAASAPREARIRFMEGGISMKTGWPGKY